MTSDDVNRQSLGDAEDQLCLMIPMEPWNDRLRRMRYATGLSQAKVAKALGIKPSSVAQWELGRSRPDPDRFPILAKIYKVTVADICGNDLPMPGQADRLALLRLYDEMDDVSKADLLRTAIRFARGGSIDD